MSTTVDERIVSMQFDNQHFEKNVQTSLSTLDKLKKSLRLDGAAKAAESEFASYKAGFTGVMDFMDDAIDKGWASLEHKVGSYIMNFATKMATAFTTEPIKKGFEEYETQMNAVQTILANTESKGKTLDDVNGALDELNAYADKTIYNFTEMTRNIGTFTAAGVDLDTSVSAIKGIANLAAVSGSTSQQASTAMYQLSQAMASGTVKLMDWNSVVNAGMGGQVFQDALKETAKVHGIKIDEIIEKQGSFRESLSEGWLTTEILTETLSKFTGDLSKEQLKSMGYTEEQIEGILKMGKTANDAATKVKTFTQLFDTLKEAAQSGWTQTWEIIVGDFEEAKQTLTKVSDVIGEMIGSSAEARNELLENWKVLGGRDDLIESISNVFNGLLDVLKPIKEAFREIFPPLVAEQLVSFTSGLKNLTEKFKLSDTASENLKRTFKGLFAVVDIIKQLFVAVVKAGSSLFGTIGDLGGGILGVTASIGDWLVRLKDVISDSNIFNKVLQGVASIVKAVFKAFKSFANFIGKKIVSPGLESIGSLLSRLGEIMSGVGSIAGSMKDGVISAFDSMGSVLEKCTLFKLMEALWKGITTLASGLVKGLGILITGLTNAIGGSGLDGIMTFINALISGGIGAGLIKLIQSLRAPLDEIGGFLEGITGILDGVKDCLKSFQQQLKANALLKIAQAIGILAAAILVLSLIDEDKVSSALAAISALFIELLAAMSFTGKLDSGKGLGKISAAMVAMSTSLLILAAAMKIMSTMSWSEIIRALLATAVGLGALLVAVNLLPETKVNKAAKAIRTMSTALLILSLALKIMGTMSWGEMAVGLVGVVAGLGALVAAVNLLPKDVGIKTLGLVSMATALVILAAALKIMGTMSWGELAVGLVALAGSLLIIVAAMKFMTSAIPGALAMLIIAPALLALAAALKVMGSMSWGELAVGLVGLAGSLLILAGAMALMMTALPGALALLVIAPALLVLSTVLVVLGSMSWEAIIKGLVSLAGALLIIGVAGLLLAPILPAILGLAGAIALIGVGILAAGVGLLAFGAGLSAVALGITALMGALSAVLVGIVAIVSAVVTGIIKGIGDGIIALCDVIAGAGSSICEAAKTVILSLCDALTASVPAIIDCVHTVLTKLLEFIIDFVPELVDAGIRLIVGLLNGIAQRIPEVIDAGVNIIESFIRGVVMLVPELINVGFEIIIDFINGMAESIRTNTELLIDAVNNLMSAVGEAIGMAIGNFPEMGKQIVSGLKKGVEQAAQGFIDSITSMASKAWNAFKDFFGIKSPSRLAAEGGMYIDEGLAVGLKKYADVASDAAVGVGDKTITSLSDALSGVADVIDSDMDLQPTIRPVVDMSDVENGVDSINKMLETESSMGVSANVGAISSMMNQRNQNGVNDDVVSAVNKLRDELKNVNNISYTINGVTYDDGSAIAKAIETIIRVANIERRT